jgi:DNA-binding XRE family transcriptional regulator
MADSLYVCQFSNGHIKVGRSVEPKSRIASHADRVACMGVELSDHFIVECVGPAGPRELQLIGRCVAAAECQYQNEWFVGLDYLTVCDWAGQAARLEIPNESDTFGHRLALAREAKGLRQAELGTLMGGLAKQSISHWECDRYSPNVTQLRELCECLGVSADVLLGLRESVCDKDHDGKAR